MTDSWNSNTVRAEKWLMLTLTVPIVSALFPAVRMYVLALGAIVAFVTTYFSLAAVRCKHAATKDVWAGIGITLIAGAIGIFSIVRLMNS